MRSRSLLICLLATCALNSVGQWSQVGSTGNNRVNAMEVYNGTLFLGGNFTNFNGNSSYFSMTYNGTTFGYHTTLIPGIGFQCFAVHDGDLFGGGGMTQSGGAQGVGVWNGGGWDGGYAVNNTVNVNALASFGGNLIVGGAFTVPQVRVAQHNGTSYSAMGAGFDGTVTDLIVFNSELYACGYMTMSGSTALGYIAKWNGSSWVNVGSGLDDGASDMEVWNGALYVCGTFTTAGGVSASGIAKWNGSTWSALGSGIPQGGGQGAFTLCATSAGLLVGGRFSSAGSVTTSNLALWDGSAWSAQAGIPAAEYVTAMQSYGSYYYLATYSVTGGSTSRLYRNGTVGIQETEDFAGVFVGPTPTMDALHVMGDLSGVRAMRLMTATGQIVIDQKRASVLHMTDLAPGSYYLLLVGDKAQRIIKVLKSQ